MPRVLIVEDDPAVSHVLKAAVEFGGFKASEATNGAEALRRVWAEAYDAVLIDLGLPDLKGPELIGEVRRLTGIPIIVVSGLADATSRIEAIEAGADDFVAKPFMPAELVARIRAVMRRHSQDPAAVEPNSSDALAGVKAGPAERRLLAVLSRRPGDLVTHKEIIREVWGQGSNRTLNNVKVLVSTLRSKLVAQDSSVSIVNEHGVGYRLRFSSDVEPIASVRR